MERLGLARIGTEKVSSVALGGKVSVPATPCNPGRRRRSRWRWRSSPRRPRSRFPDRSTSIVVDPGRRSDRVSSAIENCNADRLGRDGIGKRRCVAGALVGRRGRHARSPTARPLDRLKLMVAMPLGVGRDGRRAEERLALAKTRGIGDQAAEKLDQERGVGDAGERALDIAARAAAGSRR